MATSFETQTVESFGVFFFLSHLFIFMLFYVFIYLFTKSSLNEPLAVAVMGVLCLRELFSSTCFLLKKAP